MTRGPEVFLFKLCVLRSEGWCLILQKFLVFKLFKCRCWTRWTSVLPLESQAGVQQLRRETLHAMFPGSSVVASIILLDEPMHRTPGIHIPPLYPIGMLAFELLCCRFYSGVTIIHEKGFKGGFDRRYMCVCVLLNYIYITLYYYSLCVYVYYIYNSFI